MEELWKSNTFASLWHVCGVSLSATQGLSEGEGKELEGWEEKNVFTCTSDEKVLISFLMTDSTSILFVKKGEERMLKMKSFTLAPTPVPAMWY